MLFRQEFLSGIRAGTITLAFRRWQRPTVRAGGKILTAAGQLAIGKVEPICIEDISAGDARKAGFTSLPELLTELGARSGQVYRIELGPLRADPRIALRETKPDAAATDATLAKLKRLDARAPKPWTAATLRLLQRRPRVRAAELAKRMGMETLPFKLNVRKLKALGLTISLETGYELSPRGAAILRHLDGASRGTAE